MKYWYICISMLLWLLPKSVAATSSSTPLVFSEREFDVGTIAEDGGVVSHSFSFKNTGDEPIAIYQVSSFCKCTAADFSNEKVLPGGTGEILLRFNPMGYQGEFSKSVRIITSAGDAGLIALKGKIIPKKKTLEEQYPIVLSNALRISVDKLDFRTVVQGRPKSKIVEYANTSDQTISLDVRHLSKSGYLRLSYPKTVRPKERGEIVVEYDIPAHVYGFCSDTLMIFADGFSTGRQLVLSCIGIENFAESDLGTAPKAVLDKQYFNIGRMTSSKTMETCMFSLRNDGKSDLTVRSVRCSEYLSTNLSGDTILTPGKTITFEISLNLSSGPKGKFAGTVLVTTNDPLRPVREIMIVADKET